MNRRLVVLLLLGASLFLFPFRSPAPLIYTPGEGWVYEPVGGDSSWQRDRAKDQLIVAQDAFDRKDYSLAYKAARRVVKRWPLSDFAAQAQYLVGRSHEEQGRDEKAFKEYQKLLETYPQSVSYEEVLNRQYQIANRFLAGQWFRLWGWIPFFPSMDKTAGLYEKIVKSGPYSEIAPQAQLKLGEAREKQGDFPQAVKAYERAADRYNDRPTIAADALYKAGMAYMKQAQTAEYDQSMAGQAIATFTDFMTLYPEDARVEQATENIGVLQTEQARGSLENARYYERKRQWQAARIYYNEVVRLLLGEPDSPYVTEARQRIESINNRLQSARN